MKKINIYIVNDLLAFATISGLQGDWNHSRDRLRKFRKSKKTFNLGGIFNEK